MSKINYRILIKIFKKAPFFGPEIYFLRSKIGPKLKIKRSETRILISLYIGRYKLDDNF